MATMSERPAHVESRMPEQSSSRPATDPERATPERPGGLAHAWYAYPAVRVLAVALCVAAAALAVWLVFLRPSDDPTGAQPGAGPVASTQADLAELSMRLDLPIYWAGTRPGTQLETTLTTNEYAYVRYLTTEAPIGDAAPNYLTVATYPTRNALVNLRSYAEHERASTTRIPGGGLAVPVPDSPTSVYFARPGEDFQVEVYDPNPEEALRLIKSGTIEPVPGGVSPSGQPTEPAG